MCFPLVKVTTTIIKKKYLHFRGETAKLPTQKIHFFGLNAIFIACGLFGAGGRVVVAVGLILSLSQLKKKVFCGGVYL